MKNKVLIKLIVPDLNMSFDVFIPVNEIVWKINKMVVKSVYDLSGGLLNIRRNYIFLNKNTGMIYDNNKIVIDTDIRNGTELMLLANNI